MQFCRFVSRFVSIAGVCALVAACGDGVDEAGPEDEAAALRVAGAQDSNHEVAETTRPLAGTDGLTLALTNPELATQKLRAAAGLWALRPCVTIEPPILAINELVDVTFTNCRGFLGLARIDGTMHIELAVVGAGVERAFSYDIDSDITITTLRGTREISGGFSLDQFIDADADRSVVYAGNLSYTDLDGSTLSYDAEAQWEVTGDCINDLSGGAVLTGDRLGDLDPISLSGDGIDRCSDACPTTGSVQLSYGLGTYLTWQYTGADTVLVEGPYGKQVDVTLPCAQ